MFGSRKLSCVLNIKYFHVIVIVVTARRQNCNGKLALFYGTVMEKNKECDKEKCAGTDMHAGMRFVFQLRLLSLQSASLVRPH